MAELHVVLKVGSTGSAQKDLYTLEEVDGGGICDHCCCLEHQPFYSPAWTYKIPPLSYGLLFYGASMAARPTAIPLTARSRLSVSSQIFLGVKLAQVRYLQILEIRTLALMLAREMGLLVDPPLLLRCMRFRSLPATQAIVFGQALPPT